MASESDFTPPTWTAINNNINVKVDGFSKNMSVREDAQNYDVLLGCAAMFKRGVYLLYVP